MNENGGRKIREGERGGDSCRVNLFFFFFSLERKTRGHILQAGA